MNALPVEVGRLASLEREIESGVAAWLRMGQAFREIKLSRLYETEYRDFKDYCTRRWSLDDAYCHRLIRAVEAIRGLDPTPSYSQALALSHVSPEQRGGLWRSLIGEDAKPSARGIRLHARVRRDLVAQVRLRLKQLTEAIIDLDRVQPGAVDRSAALDLVRRLAEVVRTQR